MRTEHTFLDDTGALAVPMTLPHLLCLSCQDHGSPPGALVLQCRLYCQCFLLNSPSNVLNGVVAYNLALKNVGLGEGRVMESRVCSMIERMITRSTDDMPTLLQSPSKVVLT
jgi:hypothetical protein